MLAARHRARLAMQEGEPGARTEARKISGDGRTVRRKLFQDNDREIDGNARRSEGNVNFEGTRENIANQISEETRKNLAEAEKRWNFDFVEEKPLPGRWDWVKVRRGDDGVGNIENEGDEDGRNDWEEDDTDQREKSETEDNEKSVNKARD